MTWTVTWRPAALSQLAKLWTAALDRGAVSTAANKIESLLRHHPLDAGESRNPPQRILMAPPLVVSYKVSEDDRLVLVRAVWRSDGTSLQQRR